ncbi:transcriptional regulator, TetR family /cell division inhibitor SlmA [Methylobacillus rhizosphaerae]|uniref:Transcriptional regulator, TetR family /cell division inhibitor SlmA n=1 Tax=Methylobacillus rhizosphaerae TaxID=551994 RepID=A0A238XYK3_9PROT|nr:nucleoid occlusion factor SlmA [Methylobacillus rhizosphaerae]SNR64126.1 transcriptional regulator, TetR family /cell division inhibitor SlmA [Methylobacillus rhizosphaerae]
MALKPGERKQQILETLAKMLESPKREKITTASLAARLEVSEAALYRHFPSKARMFDGLIEFIEHTLFGLINKITSEEEEGLRQARRIVTILLLFAEKNHGMTRVLTGDALVNEDANLQARVNQLFDRIESTLKQSLRIAETQTGRKFDPESQANLLLCFVIGRWHQFAKSGFKRKPMEFVQQQLTLLYGLEE